MVTELAKELRKENFPNLKEYLVRKRGIRQENGWDCGIAIVAIIKRIREKYDGDLGKVRWGRWILRRKEFWRHLEEKNK